MAIPLDPQVCQELLGPDGTDYIGLQDLIDCKGRDWLVDVTDDTTSDREPTGSEEVALIGRTIRKAMGMVNLYLQGQYAVPLGVPVPDEVKTWTCCIAIYLLGKRRDRLDQLIVDDYNDCIEQLQMVRDSELSVPGLSISNPVLIHNHTVEDTEPLHTLTRFDRDGNRIEKNEQGSLDVL